MAMRAMPGIRGLLKGVKGYFMFRDPINPRGYFRDPRDKLAQAKLRRVDSGLVFLFVPKIS